MALQDAFYIIGIVYMSIMLLLIIAILAIEQSIGQRIDAVLAIPRKGAAIFSNVRASFSRSR
jgi:hypothetical protein